MLGRVPCSVGAWDGVERPHCVASVSQPCLCPYGVREKVLRCRIRELRVNVSAWYKYFRVVFSHPFGNSPRVGALCIAQFHEIDFDAAHPLVRYISSDVRSDVISPDSTLSGAKDLHRYCFGYP